LSLEIASFILTPQAKSAEQDSQPNLMAGDRHDLVIGAANVGEREHQSTSASTARELLLEMVRAIDNGEVTEDILVPLPSFGRTVQ
jgi:hypothetical protein